MIMCLIGNKEGKIDNDLQKQHGGGRDKRKEKKVTRTPKDIFFLDKTKI
jgi:hypothetical protein